MLMSCFFMEVFFLFLQKSVKTFCPFCLIRKHKPQAKILRHYKCYPRCANFRNKCIHFLSSGLPIATLMQRVHADSDITDSEITFLQYASRLLCQYILVDETNRQEIVKQLAENERWSQGLLLQNV